MDTLNKNENKVLKQISEKLSIYDNSVLLKGEEYIRLLQLKISSNCSNQILSQLNDSSKAIICLNLAASTIGAPFDVERALILSGLKKSAYNNSRNLIEKLLNLEKFYSISDLCIQFSCTDQTQKANKILDFYRTTYLVADNHPQYHSLAVYVACKLDKLKIDKSKLIEISRLKPIQWNRLEADFLKVAEKLYIFQRKPKLSKSESKAKEEEYQKNEETNNKKIELCEENEIIEDYEIWKKRILSEAMANPDL